MHPQKTRGPKYSDVYSCVPGYGNEMYKNHFLNSMVAAADMPSDPHLEGQTCILASQPAFSC